MPSYSFGEALRQLRIEKGLTQQQLGEILHVDRTNIAKWENNLRLPDVPTLSRLSACLDTDMAVLLHTAQQSTGAAHVLLLDDERTTLEGMTAVVREALPGAQVHGFTVLQEAREFVRENRVQLFFLDIKLGRVSGLDLCREFIQMEPHMNVVFLTGYQEYALEAWKTDACGFLEKPITVQSVREVLPRLRWPIGDVT